MEINLKEMVESFFVDIVFVKILAALGVDVMPHQGKLVEGSAKSAVLRSLPGGKGMTDEVLFAEACWLALRPDPDGGAPVATEGDILRICGVFTGSEYSIAQRKRIVEWIGFDEVAVHDQKNAESVKYDNIRGRRIIGLLAKIKTDDGIRNFLKASHVTDTVIDEAWEDIARLDERVEKWLKHLFGISPQKLKEKLTRDLKRQKTLLAQGR